MPGRPFLLCAIVSWVLCGPAALAANAQEQAEADWLTTTSGDYVVQLSTRLAWPRCVEGMRWTGRRCEGRPLRLSHADALALARSRGKAEGVAWRLPGVKELQRLAQRNLHPPRTQAPLMPVDGDEWCWSSTTPVDTSRINEYSYGNVVRGVNGQNMARLQFLHAWSVDMASAQTRGNTPKRDLLYVRLVRPVD